MPKFETVSLDLTYDCNFRCLHCFNCSGEHDKKRSLLSDDELFEIVKQIGELKPKDLCFCGGETMLREKILVKCCNYLVKQSANKMMVTAVSKTLSQTPWNFESIEKLRISPDS